MLVRMGALLVGFLGLIVACSNSDGENRFEKEKSTVFDTRPTQGESEIIHELLWNASSDRLYFSSRAPKGSKRMTYLRYYDLQTNDIEEIDTGNSSLIWFAINDCGEIAAIARDYDSVRSIFLYMEDQAQTYSAPNIEIYGSPFWISDCDSAMLIFFGGRLPDTDDMFLWTKDSSELKVLTLFDDKPLEEVNYGYRKFMKSSVKGRVVFDYYMHRRQEDPVVKTYNFGAMDVETGTTWKIISHGKGINERVDSFNWFCSRTEDAIYFFTRDESYRLDAVWKIDSLGKNMTTVLDGTEIGSPYWHTHVSWCADGGKFCLFMDASESEFRTGIYLVDIGSKKMTGLIYDIGSANFALSPNGKKIAYVSEDHALYIFNIETRAREKVHSVE